MLVILKIPVVYLCWVVWWAVRAEPEPLEGAGRLASPLPRDARLRLASATARAQSPRPSQAARRRTRRQARTASPTLAVGWHRELVRERDAHRWSTADTVAGFLATLSIFASAIGLVWRPVRIVPVAVVIALSRPGCRPATSGSPSSP